MVDSAREMTEKKSGKYSEYGSFKHLLLLCVSVMESQEEQYLNEFCFSLKP